MVKRRKIPSLGLGFSQLHWMRKIGSSDDMTAGVGVADPADPDCKKWPMSEVRRHNNRQDAWMVLGTRVYNVTPYLKFHPGSVEELMRAAGDDATALFREVHPWVNFSAMLEPCCVGVLAPSQEEEDTSGSASDCSSLLSNRPLQSTRHALKFNVSSVWWSAAPRRSMAHCQGSCDCSHHGCLSTT